MNLAFHRILQSLKLTPTPQTPRLWLAFKLRETEVARGCDDGEGFVRNIFFSFFFAFHSFASNFDSVTVSLRKSKSLLSLSFGHRLVSKPQCKELFNVDMPVWDRPN